LFLSLIFYFHKKGKHGDDKLYKRIEEVEEVHLMGQGNGGDDKIDKLSQAKLHNQ
jgi:hypothetical protein